MNPISPGQEKAAGGTTSSTASPTTIRPRQNFEVLAVVTEERRYQVDARTAEEAEQTVEGLYTDHDYGYEVVDSQITDIEAYPSEQ